MLDAREMSRRVARRIDAPAHDVIPSSTGVIGVYLPLPAIRTGIDKAFETLREDGGKEMARAMMTTDTVPKYTARRVSV